jgi:predicted RNase H-like HicB family nuclease
MPIFTARIVDGEDGWYVVTCDELPGCITQGRTVAEAEDNFAEALSLCLEVLAERAGNGKRVRPSRKAPVKVRRFGVTPV